MNDDDDTPPLRRRFQTSNDRDAAARRSQPRMDGVPTQHDPEDTTNPYDLFEPTRPRRRRVSDSVLELATKLRRDAPDPYDLIAAMAFELTHAKEQDRSANQALEEQLSGFLKQQPGGKEFDDLKRKMGIAQWLGGLVLAAAIGSLGLGVSALRSQAIHEGELNVTIERLKQDVQQLLSRKETP